MEQVRPIGEELARRVREVVIGHFHAVTREGGEWLPDDELPVLRAPGTGWGDHWVLAWEGGAAPYDWPIKVTSGGYDDYAPHVWQPGAQFPPEVFCEPINGVELGLYPPHDWSLLSDLSGGGETGGADAGEVVVPDGGAADEDAVRAALGTADAADAAVSGPCMWWLLCPNPASVRMPHPVLGTVPTCGECAAKVARLRGGTVSAG